MHALEQANNERRLQLTQTTSSQWQIARLLPISRWIYKCFVHMLKIRLMVLLRFHFSLSVSLSFSPFCNRSWFVWLLFIFSFVLVDFLCYRINKSYCFAANVIWWYCVAFDFTYTHWNSKVFPSLSGIFSINRIPTELTSAEAAYLVAAHLHATHIK